MGTLSHLKRVVSPLSRSQPHFEARDLHPTQFGKICPNETPEGPNCGLVKNLAILSKISEGSDPEELEAVIKKMGVINLYNLYRSNNDNPKDNQYCSKLEFDESVSMQEIDFLCFNLVKFSSKTGNPFGGKFVKKSKIYINGKIIGTCDDPEDFVASIEGERRSGEVSPR